MQILGIISENDANCSAPNKPSYTRPKIIEMYCVGDQILFSQEVVTRRRVDFLSYFWIWLELWAYTITHTSGILDTYNYPAYSTRYHHYQYLPTSISELCFPFRLQWPNFQLFGIWFIWFSPEKITTTYLHFLTTTSTEEKTVSKNHNRMLDRVFAATVITPNIIMYFGLWYKR